MMLPWFSRNEVSPRAGKRVLLRTPRLADYEEWRALRSLSREFLKPFEPRWTEADLARRVYAARLRRAREEARAGTDYTFFIFVGSPEGERLVGGISLSNIRRRAAQSVTLGYWMGQPFAGQGLMTEAVGVVLPFIFEDLDLHRAHAAFLPHNTASRRVLERNGFREEGYAESYLQIDGHWRDHVLVGLTRERYRAGARPSRS
jgi:ribosomal-protein-alanine N-acetyltransferase